MRATLTDVTLSGVNRTKGSGVNRTKGVLAFDLIYSGTLTTTVALGALEVT